MSVNILDIIRKSKADKQLSMKSQIEEIFIKTESKHKFDLNEKLLRDLKNVTNSKNISFKESNENIELANAHSYTNNDIELIIVFSDE